MGKPFPSQLGLEGDKVSFLIKLPLFLILTLAIPSYSVAEETQAQLLARMKTEDALSGNYEGYVNQIMRSVAKKMQQELSFAWSGDMGRMHEKVEEIGMKFHAYRRANIDEARALHLYVIDNLVQAINAHPEIQSYLEEHPFTYKKVRAQISFEGPNGAYSDGSVEYVSNSPDSATVDQNKNRIFYRGQDPFTLKSVDLISESYEEAIENAKIANVPFPFSHKTTEQEAALDAICSSFANKMLLRYGLECRAVGGDLVEGTFGASFTSMSRSDQKEARQLVVNMTEILLAYINKSPEIRPFLKEYPFSADNLKLNIKFTDSNYFTYVDGPLKTVTLDKNEITYSQRVHIPEEGEDNEDMLLIRTIVAGRESYDEALRLVEGGTPMEKMYNSTMQFLADCIQYMVVIPIMYIEGVVIKLFILSIEMFRYFLNKIYFCSFESKWL